MALEVMPCRCCKSKHPDHLKCSKCGACFSMIVSVDVYYYDKRRKQNAKLKYCPLCGEKA